VVVAFLCSRWLVLLHDLFRRAVPVLCGHVLLGQLCSLGVPFDFLLAFLIVPSFPLRVSV
jgi:hypothetical protein